MSKTRNILILNERDPAHPRAGGAEIHVEKIFSRLAERGHAITWHATGFAGATPRARHQGLSIERSSSLPTYYLGIPGRVRRARAKGEFDLIVECLNKVPFYAPLYASVPVLALCHHLFGQVAFEQVAWPIAALVNLAERGIPSAYRDCDWLAISESTREDLVHRRLSPDRIRVSHPGIDPPAESMNHEPDLERERPMRISYLGRLESYKRVEVLLHVGARLAEDFPALEIYVIGQGPERSRLEKLARELHIENRTRFTGYVDDAERDRLLLDTRVCLFPSPKEGWGLTVIEANALGTPVVARDAPGLRDSVRHEETGLLVDRDDPDAFARASARLLRDDSSVYAMRRAALDWSKQFSWSRAADEMEEAIEACLARASR